MTSIEDHNNNKIIEFNLDPSLIDPKIVKRIGIEKISNCLIVESNNHQTILQSISIGSFSKDTIKPLKKQLDEILDVTELQGQERTKIINSIITCINQNTDAIYEYCQKADSNSLKSDESNKVDNLIEIALKPENIDKVFKDQYEKPFAAVRLGNDDGHLRILPINSTKFKRYLSKLYRKNTGSSISDSLLGTVITNLASEAEFSGEVIPLHLRVAWGAEANRTKEDCIYYDMCDGQGRIIEISNEGWRIVDENSDKNNNNYPILFIKHNQKSQVEPNREYPDDIFDQLLNLTNVKNQKHRLLLKVYIISTIIPDIDHVILTTYGPKGAAKSFLLELVKKLIDPTKPILLTLHRNVDQFIQQNNHNYMNFYDNVKHISSWISDEICKAVTGIGQTKRQLYTDDEDIVYEHKRCLGLNGINVALTESDALDRSLFIELEEIDEDVRKKEGDLWKEFERIKPLVFGYILDVIAKAMQIKSSLNLETLPRMADFTEWGEAISQAMGYPPNVFVQAYSENRNEQNIVAVNENFVGFLILGYIQDIEKQFGEITTRIQYETQEFYKELVDFAANNDIRIDGRQFPKDAGNLVKRINTIRPNLKAGYGIIIEIDRNSSTNKSIVVIYRKKKDITATSTSNGLENKDKLNSGGSEAPEVYFSTSTNSENNDSGENSNPVNNDTKDPSHDNTSDLSK